MTSMALIGLQGHQRGRAGCCGESADLQHSSDATGLAQGQSQFAQSLLTIFVCFSKTSATRDLHA